MSRLRPHLAAQVLGLSPRTLHKWAREGRIVRHPDGFDLDDLIRAEASRDQAALMARAGIPRSEWPSACRLTPVESV